MEVDGTWLVVLKVSKQYIRDKTNTHRVVSSFTKELFSLRIAALKDMGI